MSGMNEPEPEPLKPAVNPKKSVFPDYIVCLEDGKKFKSLKRHLRTHYDLSPEEYREKWGLPADYPMVAPNYAAARSALAKKMGLGQQRRRGRADQPNTLWNSKRRPPARAAFFISGRARRRPVAGVRRHRPGQGRCDD